jgi:transposase
MIYLKGRLQYNGGMPKRITIQPYLSNDELAQRYREAKDAVERTHWQIIWLFAEGKTTAEIATFTRYSANWIREIVHRYNRSGPDSLGDRRHLNAGAEPLLTTEEQAELQQALQQPAPDGGRWTAKKVAAWIATKLGYQDPNSVHIQLGWDYLHRLKKTPGRPRLRQRRTRSRESTEK